MVTILISGAGTGVGKTRVCAAMARAAFQRGRAVQIIKPVQTGVTLTGTSDAEFAAKLAGLPPDWAYTLRRYRAPLAPLSAAAAEGASLNIKNVLEDISRLSPTDIRLIEGAGGIAVPLGSNGWDWVEFADEVGAKAVVLVVADELGAINQARMVSTYTQGKYRNQISTGVFLNAIKPPPPAVAASTRSALENAGVPLWGELSANAIEPIIHQPLAELLGR